MSVQEAPTFIPDTAKQPDRGRRSLRSILRYGGPAVLASLTLAACGSSSSRSMSVSNGNGNSSGNNTYSPPKPGPRVLLKGSRHTEIEQFGADTFTDYAHAYGIGPGLAQGAKVVVDCLATGPLQVAPSAHGNPGEKGAKWYHIEAPAEYAGRFAAANTFENGDTTGPLSSQPAEDPAVPACPD
jgi:hypothetical protein